MTNADRIRTMSDEELAHFIANIAPGCDCCVHYHKDACPPDCTTGVLAWLQEEVKT